MLGFFEDELHLQLVGDDEARPRFILTAPFGYTSPLAGMTIVVPAGFETDGPSIPQLAMGFTGYPGVRAAVVHDYLVGQPGIMPRESADRVFHEALLTCGVNAATAQLMYAAVAAYTDSLKPREPNPTGGGA